jgi:EpsI family protein
MRILRVFEEIIIGWIARVKPVGSPWVNGHLITLVVILGLAAGAAYIPRTAPITAVRPLPQLPLAIGEWIGSPGVPSEVLPVDPRARESGRWTYRNGERLVWVGVDLYDSRNDPQSRPSIIYIAPERDAARLQLGEREVWLGGGDGLTIPVSQVTVTRSSGNLAVLYWYQLGPKSVADEYRFRFALFLDTLLGRNERLALVRVATRVEPGELASSPMTAERFLQTFYPVLMKVLAEGSNQQSALSSQ